MNRIFYIVTETYYGKKSFCLKTTREKAKNYMRWWKKDFKSKWEITRVILPKNTPKLFLKWLNGC